MQNENFADDYEQNWELPVAKAAPFLYNEIIREQMKGRAVCFAWLWEQRVYKMGSGWYDDKRRRLPKFKCHHERCGKNAV